MRKYITFCLSLIIAFFCIASPLLAQDASPVQPRGFSPAGAYAISDIETIDVLNGNLMLTIPLVSLPAGRGGSPGATIGINYNSRYLEAKTISTFDNDLGMNVYHPILNQVAGHGWRYSFQYDFILTDRSWEFELSTGLPYNCSLGPNPTTNIWNLRVVLPDGSSHEMLPSIGSPSGQGHNLEDGYFDIRPDGYRTICQQFGTTQAIQHVPYFGSTMTYYSTDGTYLRLDVEHDGDNNVGNNQYTLYLPDGGRIVQGPILGDLTIYDRNGNFITITSTIVSQPLDSRTIYHITDQLNRSVHVDTSDGGIGTDFVTSTGANGEPLTWTIERRWDTSAHPYSAPYGQFTHFYSIPYMGGVGRITLPNGLNYSFEYLEPTDTPESTYGWGELRKITLPSGAFAHYEYFLDGDQNQTFEDYLKLQTIKRKALTYVNVHDGTSSSVTEVWEHSVAEDSFGSSCGIITGPDGGQTRQFGVPFAFAYQTPFPFTPLTHKTERPDGTVVEYLWKDNLPDVYPNHQTMKGVNKFIKTEFTSIRDAAGTLVKTAIKDYRYDKNGNVTQVKEYDFVNYGSVPRSSLGRPLDVPAEAEAVLKRVTYNTYFNPTPDAADISSPSANAYYRTSSPFLRTAIESTEIRSGTGELLSRTEFTYDNPSTSGNPTLVRSWDSTKGGSTVPLTASNSISVSHQYDGFGNRVLTVDANTNRTEMIYGDINGFSGLYVTEISSGDNSSVQHTSRMSYNFLTGQVSQLHDVDNNLTSSTSYDRFGRPVLVKQAEGSLAERHVETIYDDAARRVITKSDRVAPGDGKLVSVSHFDQLGRIRLTRQLEDAATQNATDETQGIKRQTRYLYSGSNKYELTSTPYRATTSGAASAEPTMGWTRKKHNNGGRIIEVETFAGSGLPAPWDLNTTTTGKATTAYNANFVTTTDQDGKVRRTVVDGLARLVRVDEPIGNNNLGSTSSPSQPTSYSFDALDNLLTVTQSGQIRNFAYSSLSRLTSATNPEICNQQGAQCIPIPVTYSYYDDGSLKDKTDARSITTHLEYDSLNRTISRTYLNDADGTPSVHYFYDSQSLPQGAPALDRGPSAGRLVAVLYGDQQSVTGNYYGYDELGRIKRSIQVTNDGAANQTYIFPNYEYDLAGNLKSQTYPSGRVVATEFDSAGRIAGVKNQVTGAYYAGAAATDVANRIQYSAHGAMSALKLGNGLWEHTNFNSRLQPTQTGLGTATTNSSVLQLDFGYGTTTNNGNLLGQTITIPGLTLSQTFGYDELNRLETAAESAGVSWKQKFVYDRYGNRRIDSNLTNTSPDLVGPNPVLSEANNRIVAQSGEQYEYDRAGNLTRGREGQTYTFDAKNKMTSFNGGASQGGANYSYDGDGNRVKKVVGNATTIFVYDLMGLVAEYSGSPAETNGTQYLTSDPLGSPRVITDSNGAVQARHDYHPFGEEVSLRGGRNDGYIVDKVRQKFTSKERDSETGLDYFLARYYSSPQGRFSGVDPHNPILDSAGAEEFLAYLAQPQKWNRYVYAVNNPLKYVDPSGEDIALTGTEEEQKEALERIRRLLGAERFKLVDFNRRNVAGLGMVTVVDFGSDENRRKFEAVGGNNAYEVEFSQGMADIIGSKDIVEYRLAETFKMNSCILCICETVTKSVNEYGGAGTLNRDESLTGNVQIFVSRSATDTAFWALENNRQKGVKVSSDGDVLMFTPEQVDAHEFGHGHNVIKFGMRAEPSYRANRFENILRLRQGSPNTRIHH